MKLKNLLLSTDIFVDIEYHDLNNRFNKILEHSSFKENSNNNDGAVFYYRSDFLVIPGFSKMPITQLKLKRTSETIGRTKIIFKFNKWISVLLGLVITILWTSYIFNINQVRTSGGIGIPTLGSLLFYGVAFLRYKIELLYFRADLNKLA
ncbi:MAG: hypothetical protein ABJA70_23680, partial [Chryseolinea sp.]